MCLERERENKRNEGVEPSIRKRWKHERETENERQRERGVGVVERE